MNLGAFITERRATLERRITDLTQQINFAQTELHELTEIDPKDANDIPHAVAHLTVRQLILRAFVDSPQFREHGASNGQMIVFFSKIYGRNVPKQTLHPQLSKNKQNGYVSSHDGRWFVTKAGFEIAARS